MYINIYNFCFFFWLFFYTEIVIFFYIHRLMCCVIHIKRDNYVNLETYVMLKYGSVFTFYTSKTCKIMTNLKSLKSNIPETLNVKVNS